ncbi:MAG: hypothetical protein QW432_06660 [Desulfurococcaceae archaeon]
MILQLCDEGAFKEMDVDYKLAGIVATGFGTSNSTCTYPGTLSA